MAADLSAVDARVPPVPLIAVRHVHKVLCVIAWHDPADPFAVQHSESIIGASTETEARPAVHCVPSWRELIGLTKAGGSWSMWSRSSPNLRWLLHRCNHTDESAGSFAMRLDPTPTRRL